MRVLLLDVETSGLVYDEGARVIEVACALFDCKHASIIESYSCLIRHHENGAESVNGIPVSLLQEHGDEPASVWARVLQLAVQAECYVAHRAEFDRAMMTKSVEALGGGEHWSPDKPWVCTKTDIEWPGGLRGDHLAHLALGLGLGVSSAHRAMTDVDTMARCLTRAAERGMLLESVMLKAMRPKVRVVALVSYDQRELAKAAGFLWDDKRRQWYRHMAAEDVEGLAFRAQVQP